MSTFRVRNVATRQIEPGLPSPMLISVGGGMAYDTGEGFWRLRDESYDPKGTVYTLVSIEHTEDYRVDVYVAPVGPDGPEDSYDDYFIVEAAGTSEALSLGEDAAREDVENRYGEGYSSVVTTVRARRGVSI